MSRVWFTCNSTPGGTLVDENMDMRKLKEAPRDRIGPPYNREVRSVSNITPEREGEDGILSLVNAATAVKHARTEGTDVKLDDTQR